MLSYGYLVLLLSLHESLVVAVYKSPHYFLAQIHLAVPLTEWTWRRGWVLAAMALFEKRRKLKMKVVPVCCELFLVCLREQTDKTRLYSITKICYNVPSSPIKPLYTWSVQSNLKARNNCLPSAEALLTILGFFQPNMKPCK